MAFGKRNGKNIKRMSWFSRLSDATIPFELRIMMIVAITGAIGNSLGFIANFALYGMNIPTAFCAVCAVLLILYLFFGLHSKHYRLLGWGILILLDLLEFPVLVFTYGSVMYPYLMIGFLALLMISKGKKRILFNSFLALYDVFVIVASSIHPFIFGPQDSAGLLGSAVITFIISLGALTGCAMTWRNVSVIQTSDIDSVSESLTRVGFLRMADVYLKSENASQYAVLFFDIRNFKVVNSVCGQDGGNEFLHEVSEKLRKSSLKPLLISRLNADRFACLVRKEDIQYEELNDICKLDYSNNGKSIPLVMHCGIFLIEKSGESAQTICDKAELARRFVRKGTNKYYEVYNENTALTYQQETELLGELDSAIREQVFEPFYQPIVDCKTGKVVSAEALVRWNHPTKGILYPNAFIPILEKKELVSELDFLMAEKVSTFLISRNETHKAIVPVSVNLSRIDLYDNHLMERLKEIVLAAESGNVQYRFELTESAYESLPEETVKMLTEFRKHGAKILLDDFGTGFSALNMITDYEFDFIKLDMSFTKKIETSEKVRGVVRSLIEMAHKLDLKVIMEGVENKEQLDILQGFGCDQIQGFYFYKPMPEKEFIKVLENQ